MTVEVLGKELGYAPSEAEFLETLFLSTLEEHDGLCLGNQPEREALAANLVAALVTAAKDGTIELARLLKPLQTGDNSIAVPLVQ